MVSTRAQRWAQGWPCGGMIHDNGVVIASKFRDCELECLSSACACAVPIIVFSFQDNVSFSASPVRMCRRTDQGSSSYSTVSLSLHNDFDHQRANFLASTTQYLGLLVPDMRCRCFHRLKHVDSYSMICAGPTARPRMPDLFAFAHVRVAVFATQFHPSLFPPLDDQGDDFRTLEYHRICDCCKTNESRRSRSTKYAQTDGSSQPSSMYMSSIIPVASQINSIITCRRYDCLPPFRRFALGLLA
ncbi:uncharacterized protein MYCFIDRAFT_170256 [Pseudocercospora fijiensis CIRAD86]|uniref:Uncharacterized protein n=1 Tax=Pseudocercospora fijiensis (strain CIRAD86) TaxID=383855 RepID=N1Q7J4_PSEFD|nr:uncharacterized protein MYCFIDRAFT_170256 [Pseudocercospora fijiensis CIRAD86]EME88665.1 hypothetical protein MYCFIDRAFT_170256 [Pseudocercospora fijiensis CIRAD86]